MSNGFKRGMHWVLGCTLIGLSLPLVAAAGTINIILSDMDVSYLGAAVGNTGALYDSIGVPGGNLNPAEADVLETAVFEMNGALVGTLMSTPNNTISGDMKIAGVGNTLATGILHSNIGSNGPGYGFDLFMTNGDRLRLGINAVDLLVTQGVLFFTGNGTILDQNLPFGLAMDASQPVVFSYVATLPGLVGGNPITGAMASGAMTITGQMLVPEPSTVALVGLAVSGLGLLARRRRIA